MVLVSGSAILVGDCLFFACFGGGWGGVVCFVLFSGLEVVCGGFCTFLGLSAAFRGVVVGFGIARFFSGALFFLVWPGGLGTHRQNGQQSTPNQGWFRFPARVTEQLVRDPKKGSLLFFSWGAKG